MLQNVSEREELNEATLVSALGMSPMVVTETVDELINERTIRREIS